MATLSHRMMEEHGEVGPDIELLRATADSLSWMDVDEVRRELDQVITLLREHLIPHADEEESPGGLYTQVDQALGLPHATATMRFDHGRIRQMTGELVAVRRVLQGLHRLDQHHSNDLRRLLYGLSTLVTEHIAKEEAVLVPMLATPD